MKFDISNNNLYSAGAKALVGALKGNQVMTELNISSNFLGYKDGSGKIDMSGVIAIGDAIPTMRALTSLNVSDNSLVGGYYTCEEEWISDMTGIKALAAAIPECK